MAHALRATDGVAHEPREAAGLLRASRKASRAGQRGQDQAGNRGRGGEAEMTGWQMAMELYHAMPTPLAQRQPMNDTTGRKMEAEDEQAVDARNREPVSVEEVAMFRELSALGWSASRISTATGRSKKSVLRYLKGERTPRE